MALFFKGFCCLFDDVKVQRQPGGEQALKHLNFREDSTFRPCAETSLLMRIFTQNRA
jgi:hypothetical protein